MPKSEDLSLQDLYDRVTLRLRDLYKDNQDLKAALEEKDREKAALQGLYDGIRDALAQAEEKFEVLHGAYKDKCEALAQAEQRVRELEDEVLGLRCDLQDLDP
jgi:cell division septum initiation protein DivIVA